MKTDMIGIGNLDKKLQMLKSQLNQCIQSYHDPMAFIAQAESMIQSLRNYTFAIQANKKSIPNFDSWYEPWRDRMKNDDYIKWLADKRTSIVHNDALATTSNAVLTLDTDHAQTVITKSYGIMTDTEDIIKNSVKLADKEPSLKHATGKIERHYLFNVDGDSVNALDLLSAGVGFMHILSIDLSKTIKKQPTIKGNIPSIKGKFLVPTKELNILFKLKDGLVLNETITRISRKDMLKDSDAAKERYGTIKLKNKLRSKNKLEIARAHFEIAKHIFNKDGNHITMMQVHDKRGWSMITPMFRDRAEKIAFWRSFASTIKKNGIDEVIVTTESWIYKDVEKGKKQILAGKEIGSLRNKGEMLHVDYINKSGKVLVISAPITRGDGIVTLGDESEITLKPIEYPIYYPVFIEWGLIDKLVHKHTYKWKSND